MDSRDIKEAPEEVKDGKYLEKIYDLQKVLIDHYVKIEGLPPYPLDVNTKKSQTLIKDFVGRVIEELAEGHEAFMLVDGLTQKNRLWFGNYSDKDYQEMINHLQNANEELADALHFMIELLIYSNIHPVDIREYINFKYPQVVSNMDDEGILNTSMILGYCVLLEIHNNVEAKKIMLADPTITPDDLSPLIKAGSLYNEIQYNEEGIMLWEITHNLNMARNCLKNKPWKQSQMMTDEELYQSYIVEAFIRLVGYYKYMGLEPYDIYYLYFKKNKVNQFRIKSNY